ncbi:hypothetical protein R20233_04899 [Ralstonia sp. LMG 32965]|uniref:hypothetical protein n=1 Tax=Ralstonia flatus TaxID=3058601 RepID=UPI0028F65148|nr:hypothetical protein [Ralstonia sp. LMG 32965]CAJ0903177.1 hypothetical protein R20233_04899 [Ralstonia sp. LMG 32965]
MSTTATANTATNELIRHAIAAWGYLVRWGSRLTLAEFAAAIRRHSAHARAEAMAAALESATGFVARDWRGFRASWQC